MDRAGVRPLGLLEKLYTARHSLSLYYSIIVLNTYRSEVSYNDAQLEVLFSHALSWVTGQHPALCYCLHGESTKNPSFVLADEIDLSQKLSFRASTSDASLLQQLESEHDTSWTDQEKSPPWRVIIFQSPKAQSTVFDVAFVYHHGLADGLSGSVFHSSLMAALSELSNQVDSSAEPIRRVSVQPPSLLTPPVEELVKFNISWSFLASQVLQEYGPRFLFGRKTTPYTGQDCTVSDLIPYRTRLRSLNIGPQTVKQLLAKCKTKYTSMTCLLSLVLVHSLAIAVPSAESFIGTIPYTLRTVSGTNYHTMVNQTSALETEYSTELLQRLRESEPEKNAQVLLRQLWMAAEQESARLRSHITNCLDNNLVGLLPYVSDHHDFYRKKLDRKREQTFEVSNVGTTKPRRAIGSPWTVERVIFTQGAAVVGPALSLNVASVIDGPSTLTFSWQEKIIEDHTMTAVVSHFESVLKTLASE